MRYFLLLLLISSQQILADVNILVVGPNQSSSNNISGAEGVSGFQSEDIATELSSILEGGSHGEVNVVFENTNEFSVSRQFVNLFSWLYFPYTLNLSLIHI